MSTDEYGLPKAQPQEVSPGGNVRAGDRIHFLKSTVAWGDVHGRGDSIELSAELIAATIDAKGCSWLDSVDDEESRIGRGPFPESLDRWLPGSGEQAMAYEAAKREAHALPVAADRARAMAELNRRFPGVGSTSREAAQYYGGAGR